MKTLEALARELDGFAASFGPNAAAPRPASSEVWVRAAERFAGKLTDGDHSPASSDVTP
jgi:hypothetical protein